jgi:hypothetical protein
MSKTAINTNFIEKASPLKQILVVGFVAVVCLIGLGLISHNEEIEWFVTASAITFFVWTNLIIGCFQSQKWFKYILQSFVFLGLMSALLITLSSKFASIGLLDLPAYRTMFGALFVFYLCGSMVVFLIRYIAQMIGIN